MDFLPGWQAYFECEQDASGAMAIIINAITFAFATFMVLFFLTCYKN